ncbi:hypothetical protein JCM11641_004879 [Rhodosporidiobolus odoratus]
MSQDLEKPTKSILSKNVGLLGSRATSAWLKAIRAHITSEYDKWDIWQALQANNYLLAMQRRLKKTPYHDLARSLLGFFSCTPSDDRDALNPSREDINEIIETLVKERPDQRPFVRTINEWFDDNWEAAGEPGKEAIVKSLLGIVEVFKRSGAMEGYEDAVIGKLNAALSTVEHTPPSAMHPLMTLDQGFGVEHWKGPMHPDLHRGRRSPELPSIGHRAAKHYGTTKARWEAGYRW